MCLAIPGKIEAIDEHQDPIFRKAMVSFGGIMREVNLSMIEGAKPGDYVLVHVGVAISIIDEEEAQKVFEYLQEMGELEDLDPKSTE